MKIREISYRKLNHLFSFNNISSLQYCESGKNNHFTLQIETPISTIEGENHIHNK